MSKEKKAPEFQVGKILSVSILGGDLAKALDEVKIVEDLGVSMLHLDVMDGHFVDNISFGADFIKSLRGRSTLLFDTHLMIEDPERSLDRYIAAGSDIITVHAEATRHLYKCISSIKEAGLKAGVALNPATSLNVLSEVLEYLDLVLVMSVEPGFCKQKFIPSSLKKITELCQIRRDKGLKFQIEIDGGVGLDNIEKVKKAGTDVIVSASSFFASPNKKAFVEMVSC